MRMRHIRLLAATGTAVAALALTACGGGTGTEDEGASGPTAARTDATKTAGSASTGGSGSNSGTGGSGGSGSHGTGGGTAGSTADGAPVARTHAPGAQPDTSAGHSTKGGSAGGSVVLCNGANTTVTAQPLNRPLNHLLLTVKNTGGRTCELPYYPVLRFDGMQWVPQADRDTQPQAVVSLAPGASGYAGVLLSAADGSGTGGTTGHKLTVAFQGYTPNSSGGPSATPPLPAKGLYYDSSLKVTYWQQDPGAISSW